MSNLAASVAELKALETEIERAAAFTSALQALMDDMEQEMARPLRERACGWHVAHYEEMQRRLDGGQSPDVVFTVAAWLWQTEWIYSGSVDLSEWMTWDVAADIRKWLHDGHLDGRRRRHLFRATRGASEAARYTAAVHAVVAEAPPLNADQRAILRAANIVSAFVAGS